MINGYIFYFLGQLFSGQLFEIFARETNLMKKRSVNTEMRQKPNMSCVKNHPSS